MVSELFKNSDRNIADTEASVKGGMRAIDPPPPHTHTHTHTLFGGIEGAAVALLLVLLIATPL